MKKILAITAFFILYFTSSFAQVIGVPSSAANPEKKIVCEVDVYGVLIQVERKAEESVTIDYYLILLTRMKAFDSTENKTLEFEQPGIIYITTPVEPKRKPL